MSTCTKKEEEVKVVVKTTEERFEITLTEEEAISIAEIIGLIDGNPGGTVRVYTDMLWARMDKVLGRWRSPNVFKNDDTCAAALWRPS